MTWHCLCCLYRQSHYVGLFQFPKDCLNGTLDRRFHQPAFFFEKATEHIINPALAGGRADPDSQPRDLFRAKLHDDRFETVTATPEEFTAFLKAEIPKWASVIQSARIKAE